MKRNSSMPRSEITDVKGNMYIQYNVQGCRYHTGAGLYHLTVCELLNRCSVRVAADYDILAQIVITATVTATLILLGGRARRSPFVDV